MSLERYEAFRPLLERAQEALKFDVTPDTIPAELRANVLPECIPALCEFCSTGDDPDGKFLAHLDTCESCQKVLDWAFERHVDGLHEFGRRMGVSEKQRTALGEAQVRLNKAQDAYLVAHGAFVRLQRDVANPPEELWQKAQNALKEAGAEYNAAEAALNSLLGRT